MFDCLFGWRKASKCKKLIKRVQSRLKLLKTKRQSIVRQLRDDVAQLINIGYEDLAFKRAEHLFNDETVIELYELLENFCEFIISQLSYIRRNKDCPNDINEAVSSLIFASARCGDLPELRAVRKLFRERYGHRFETTALELLPGNLVNFQVKEKLSIESVPDDMKQKLLDEIAKEHCLQTEILAIEFESELHQQIAGSCKPENRNPESHQDDTISTMTSSSIIEQCSSYVMEYPVNSFEAVSGKESQMTGRSRISNSDRKTEASSSESLPQIPDEMIVYLDDIEEVKHCNERDGTFQDQRVFKFKSPVKLQKDTKGIDKDSFDAGSDSDSSRKRVVNAAARRRTKRRSMSQENLSVKDIHCVIYYDKPRKKCPTSESNKHYKNAEKRRKHPNSGGGLERRTEQDITGESDTEMELYTFPTRFRRRRGSCDLGDIAYKQSKKMNGSHCHIAPNDSNSKTTSPLTRKVEKPPYLRAMTMPQERSKEIHSDNVQRSVSFPAESPNHVHPKLPDYDEIAAKFMALKKEHRQNKHD